MSTSTLTLNSISKEFIQGSKKVSILHDISIVFEQNKSYAIVGASGSGKSTLFHLLGGLEEPTSGSVEYNGTALSSYTHEQKMYFLNRTVGFIFQFHYLIDELNVLENTALTGLIAGLESKESCLHRATLLLNELGLSEKKHAHPYQLSGGEQQRVSFARALFNRPAFIIADEPTGNLDRARADELIDLLLKAQREWGVGIIMCSHDPEVYKRMETVYELHEGKLVVIQSDL